MLPIDPTLPTLDNETGMYTPNLKLYTRNLLTL